MTKIAGKLTCVALALRLCCPRSDLTTLLENYAVLAPEEYICYLYSLGSASHQSLWTSPGTAVEDGIPVGRRLEGFPGGWCDRENSPADSCLPFSLICVKERAKRKKIQFIRFSIFLLPSYPLSIRDFLNVNLFLYFLVPHFQIPIWNLYFDGISG